MEYFPHTQLTTPTTVFSISISGQVNRYASKNEENSHSCDTIAQNSLDRNSPQYTGKYSNEESTSKRSHLSRVDLKLGDCSTNARDVNSPTTDSNTKYSSDNNSVKRKKKSQKPDGIHKGLNKNLNYLGKMYDSKYGWDSPEAKTVIDFHSRGLLCFNNEMLFEHKVQVMSKTEGTAVGIAHWFALNGLVVIDKDKSMKLFSNSDDHSNNSTSYTPVSEIPTNLPNILEISKNNKESENILPSLFTSGEESPCNQACFVLDNSLDVLPHHNIVLDCVYKYGNFWIDLE